MCKLDLSDYNQSTKSIDYFNPNLPKNIAISNNENIQLQEDFYILRTNYKFNQKTCLKTKQKGKKFVITFTLKGNAKYENHNKQIIDFKKGYTTISIFEKSNGIRRFEDKEIDQIRIILNENFLKRNFQTTLLDKYLDDSKIKLIDFSPTNFESQVLIKEIFDYEKNSELNCIYIQSKALEILHLEINRINKNNDKKLFLDEYDTKQIYKAKEILFENIKNPPSIVDLSKQVHLNEFKLKNGFKQVFNTTPYKLLFKYKMQKAKHLLQSQEYNINEVAKECGYKYSNNFSDAFYKEFKISPKKFMKQYTYTY
ncbi:helix-turn-helix domain-containing protein [Halarcobacter sp.]|uniref:helix-turn-helix domain-containing protein n=1 Tax=Halarcobacter sp. TaxID=2321133 RepID=UPI003B00D7A2